MTNKPPYPIHTFNALQEYIDAETSLYINLHADGDVTVKYSDDGTMVTFFDYGELGLNNETTVKNELSYDEHGLSVDGYRITIEEDVSYLFNPNL